MAVTNGLFVLTLNFGDRFPGVERRAASAIVTHTAPAPTRLADILPSA